MSDGELINQAREEAAAIVQEAREQAEILLKAAVDRRKAADGDVEEIRAQGIELARNLERSIQLLTQVLEELRRSLG